ncbi:hypothetical protein [Aquabacterium sp. CECT 9606]|uniref:recombination directionality factor n=1 Tax=Aquabacterium sp. CECT 9606 TaxID=2845822 RepID=UPI001E349DD5|nr:hypothetical protein [Aquabacterium sp. CECT 9606]CAH0353289.1 hypothetical protein AQB9606_03156 [Aquabacterium sp. CECT 9606]
MVKATITVQGGTAGLPTLLGQGPARIPTGGKIRAGIKVLTRKAAEQPQAQRLYDEGVEAGQSFDQIERAIVSALPQLKSPLIPRNVPWFTVRAQDFPNPETPKQILQTYGDDRGEGLHLYRFPIVFPSDHWQTVMPHELAAWGAQDKRYWSQYSADGRVRHCVCHAPVPMDSTGRRSIRIFGGRKTVLREDNGGICEPEACIDYQQRRCNLTGRFLFFIPGIRSISAFELPTTSFYAMNAAIQRFETIGFLRGGRISGFLDRERTPFYLTKRLMDVAHIDENGQPTRVSQWIIELEAPVDVTALLRDREDEDTTIVHAQLASQVLEGLPRASLDAGSGPDQPATQVAPVEVRMKEGEPNLDKLLARAQDYEIAPDQYLAYADQRWGLGWKINPHGRRRAWDELERYCNDPQGYLDKIESELHLTRAGERP